MELLGRYSNQAKLREKLQGLLLMEAARSPDEPSRPPKQVQVRLSAAQEVELLERYLAGERAFELAKAYGVDRRTVADRLSRAGVRRPRSMTDQERIDAARLYGQGWSCAPNRRPPRTPRWDCVAGFEVRGCRPPPTLGASLMAHR